MKVKQLVLFLLSIGLCNTSIYAQPKLIDISFSKENLPVFQVGNGAVGIELIFDSEMDTTVAPVIDYSRDLGYGLTFPAQGTWVSLMVWQGTATITGSEPATGDGEYVFRVTGAQNTGATIMDPAFSTDIDNTTLKICRAGQAGLSADSLNFGNTAPGKAKDLQLIIKNAGCTNLKITSFALSAPFSIVNQISEATLSEGDSLVLTVRFSLRSARTMSIRSRSQPKMPARRYIIFI